ncbi:MAG: tetratricopeptide repeat protein [Armatimonadota bacterium]|jgi:tetratricopeptide (TPR) repeat protein
MQDAAEARDRGIRLFRQGQYEDAALYLKQARDAAPQDLAVHFHLGAALFQLGRHEEAIASFGEAVKIDPESAQAHFNLAQAYVSLGRAGEAVYELQTVQRLRPDYPGLDDALARAQQMAMQPPQAVEHGPLEAAQPAPAPTHAPGGLPPLEQPPALPPPQPVAAAPSAPASAPEDEWYTQEELEEAERRETAMLNRGKLICCIAWAPGTYFLFAIFAAVGGMFYALAPTLVILIPLVYLVILDAHEFMAVKPKLMTYIAIAGGCVSVGMFIWAWHFGLFE